MTKINSLSDKWFEENGYWKRTYDSSSRIGRYYNKKTNKYVVMINKLLKNNGIHVYPSGMKLKRHNSNTFKIRLIMPEEVLEYINGYK